MTPNETTATTTKPLPRFIRSGRGRGADEIVRPVPPSLMKLAADEEVTKTHENRVERYGEARTRLIALGSALEEARRVDESEQRAAAEAGRKRKPPKATKVEEEIEEARSRVEALSKMIEESAVDLLRAVVPFLPQADEEARTAVETALTVALDALGAAHDRFTDVAKLAAEATWIATLRREGEVAPWTATRGQDHPTPKAASLVREAIVAFSDDRQRAAERLEHAAREREHQERMKLPIGSTVWREGSTYTVDESGELVEVLR